IGQSVRPGRSKLQNWRKLQAPREIPKAADGHVMAFVVGRRTPVVVGKWFRSQNGIIAERSTAAAERISPSQGVVGKKREVMRHALTVAEVVAIVLRAANRLLVTDTSQLRKGWIGIEGRTERRIAALRADGLSRVRNFLVDVHGLVFVQAK